MLSIFVVVACVPKRAIFCAYVSHLCGLRGCEVECGPLNHRVPSLISGNGCQLCISSLNKLIWCEIWVGIHQPFLRTSIVSFS